MTELLVTVVGLVVLVVVLVVLVVVVWMVLAVAVSSPKVRSSSTKIKELASGVLCCFVLPPQKLEVTLYYSQTFS